MSAFLALKSQVCCFPQSLEYCEEFPIALPSVKKFLRSCQSPKQKKGGKLGTTNRKDLRKLTVWCALWTGGIIGQYFFKNDEGHNVTVNGDRYRAMITNFFIPELNNHDVQQLWFQQDGATCRTARATIDLFKDTFGDRLILRFGPVNWPPRSCDLTPLDYFLWGYVKSLVYADKPQTLDHLEDNIRLVIADIRPQMLEKVIENCTSRLDYIRASRGSPMPEIIFKIDEAHFWLNGYVNKQNCRIWSEANPHVYVETPLHPEKLTVWCALWAGGIIGPYFFKNDEGHNELWFHQDCATCHTARATIDLLKDTFVDRLISRFGPVNWPPRSCNLTPLDYFLWGYVKSLVYADKPQTSDHLEDNIRRVIADIRAQMLEKVIESWTSRLDYIRASRGSHMTKIIFKM
ncbi:transposable element Tc3 transposase [Trichonephila clavipes]|nr:transposable element Tc3 transposase [Trichonephila clavipes]